MCSGTPSHVSFTHLNRCTSSHQEGNPPSMAILYGIHISYIIVCFNVSLKGIQKSSSIEKEKSKPGCLLCMHASVAGLAVGRRHFRGGKKQPPSSAIECHRTEGMNEYFFIDILPSTLVPPVPLPGRHCRRPASCYSPGPSFGPHLSRNRRDCVEQ